MYAPNVPKVDIDNLHSQAVRCAEKICGGMGCVDQHFDCGHAKVKPRWRPLPKIGTLEECPLQKYAVKDKERPPRAPSSSVEPSDAELFAVCAECDHATCRVDETGKNLVVEHGNGAFEKFCVDCPVKDILDALQERRAEGRMS